MWFYVVGLVVIAVIWVATGFMVKGMYDEERTHPRPYYSGKDD